MRTGFILHAAVIAGIALGVERLEAQQAGDERDAVRGDDAASSADADLEMSERRNELVQQADEALARLQRENETAAELLEQAYGHAVFNATKGGLLLTGAGGTGLARPRTGDEVVFMRLGSAGLGLGAGFESYKLVLLFADEETYANFISGQWDGTLAAQASAGREGVAAAEQFLGGVRAFHLTDGGLMAQVDVTGTRFWPSRRLNQAAEIEARVAAAARTGRTQGLADGADQREDAEQDIAVAAGEPVETVTTDEPVQTEEPAPRPERLDELAAERDDLGVFIEAVRTAGLADALTGDTAYTLFAPTDEAFESLPDWTREELLAPENRAELIRLLRRHIVADDLDREMAGNISQAMTLDGDRVDVDVDGDRFSVANASVIEPDIRRGNLRVHVVDGVLSPPVRVAEADIDEEAETDVRVSVAPGEAQDEARQDDGSRVDDTRIDSETPDATSEAPAQGSAEPVQTTEQDPAEAVQTPDTTVTENSPDAQ